MEDTPDNRKFFNMVVRRDKTDDEIAAINRNALHSAMNALYDTHIEAQEIANARGEAIQAIERMYQGLGFGSLVEEIESVPVSKRRRESPRWK